METVTISENSSTAIDNLARNSAGNHSVNLVSEVDSMRMTTYFQARGGPTPYYLSPYVTAKFTIKSFNCSIF